MKTEPGHGGSHPGSREPPCYCSFYFNARHPSLDREIPANASKKLKAQLDKRHIPRDYFPEQVRDPLARYGTFGLPCTEAKLIMAAEASKYGIPYGETDPVLEKAVRTALQGQGNILDEEDIAPATEICRQGMRARASKSSEKANQTSETTANETTKGNQSLDLIGSEIKEHLDKDCNACDIWAN